MKRVKGYFVVASTSERTSGRVLGPYKDRSIAAMECTDRGAGKGVGWYGSNDGSVIEVEFFEDEQGQLYEVPKPRKFVDIERKYVEEQLSNIKNKLTPEEWNFINKHIQNEYELES